MTRLPALVVFLVLGTAISLVLAFRSSTRGFVSSDLFHDRTIQVSLADAGEIRLWRRYADTEWKDRTLYVINYPDNASRLVDLVAIDGPSLPGVPTREQLQGVLSDRRHFRLSEVSYGWPLGCLRVRRWGLHRGEWSSMYSSDGFILDSDRIIPMRVSVVGLVMDALLFGLLAWIVALLGNRIRARSRIAAGICPECKYPLKDRVEHGCPECGWGRETSDGEVASVSD